MSNIQLIALTIGIEKGYYLQQGIDLKLITVNAGSESAKAVQAGEAQSGTMGFGSLAAARAQSIKLRVIALLCSSATDPTTDAQMAIIATGKSGITSVQDLVGKKVMTTTGVAPDFYLKAVLAKNGITEDKLQLLNTPPPNMLAALEGGSVDAGSAAEPYPELFLAKLPGSKVVSRGGGYIAQRPILVSTEGWLAANRPLVERFVAGTAQATQFIRKDPDGSAEISSRWLTGIEVPILRKAIGHVPWDVRMSPAVRQGWEYEVGDLVKRGTLKQMVPFDEAVDVALLEGVSKQHPEFFNDLPPLPA
ncbi:MAG: ABC transporter substrate-binding protein [Chloroflexi bacterium]|nr:ABC transporter substrate-binding protein [Chloroflexota bacterium]